MAGGSVPVTVREVDAITAHALGIRPGGELLVRPDGVRADARELAQVGADPRPAALRHAA